MTTDYRTETFRKRFEGAARHLKVRPDQVVSMKLRENVSSTQEYHNLIKMLEHEAGLRSLQLDADLQGRGYLVGDDKTKVILVEHETGLEILYIAGSIASLVSLVPVILQGWRAMRGGSSERYGMIDHGVEIRRMDTSGQLHEEHMHNAGTFMSTRMLVPALVTAAGLIENEMKALNKQVQSLAVRVSKFEKQRAPEHQARNAKRSSGKRKRP